MVSKIILAIPTLFSIIPALSEAAELPSYCNSSDISKIQVRLYPDQKNSGLFTYRYQVAIADSSNPSSFIFPEALACHQ